MALIGIDLGTTFCAVAALDERGRPVTVPNRDGDVLTPSAVYLGPDGTAVVGQPALDLALDHPDRVATLVKRRMGYADLGHPVAGRTFRPETLSAVILRKLADDAARQLGRITGCVITVPAYFDDTRRKATMDAGRIAGLDVLDIVDEPSAAALAYSLQGADGPTPGTVLVYDLGGGTFDVTVVSLGKKRFRVLAVEGDVRLGGKDWDDKLVDWAADRFQREAGGADPRLDPLSLVALQAAAERAKRTLSKVEQTTLTVTHAGRRVPVPLSRAEFESVTKDLLVRTRLTTQQVLRQAALTWDKIDRVLLVGGSTHMPAVGKMLAEVTGKEPDRSLAVSEVVARGAAAHAGVVQQREQGIRRGDTPVHELLADVIEISVNAHSLGVEVKQPDGTRRNNILIAKNTQLPAAVTREYYTIGEGQSRVRVRILQGESPQAAACIPVGECWIDGLPAELPKGSPVEVRCGVAANGRIEVTARDRASGRTATATIHRPGGLTEAQLAAEAEWVRGLKIQ
jgi:molecular chaperone DnaK